MQYSAWFPKIVCWNLAEDQIILWKACQYQIPCTFVSCLALLSLQCLSLFKHSLSVILYVEYFTFAKQPISKISKIAIAFVWSLGVIAASISIAVVLSQSALVNIWKTDTSILGTIEYSAQSLYNSELSVNGCIDKGSKIGKRSQRELMFHGEERCRTFDGRRFQRGLPASHKWHLLVITHSDTV